MCAGRRFPYPKSLHHADMFYRLPYDSVPDLKQILQTGDAEAKVTATSDPRRPIAYAFMGRSSAERSNNPTPAKEKVAEVNGEIPWPKDYKETSHQATNPTVAPSNGYTSFL